MPPRPAEAAGASGAEGAARPADGGAGDGRLTIAVSTLGERAAGLRLPPPDPLCDILVLVQGPERLPDPPPPWAARPDVTLVRLPGRGVAASRNAALERARTEFLLFWDDDLDPDPAGIARLRAFLAARPGLAFATGLRRGLAGRPLREGGRHRALTRLNSARVATPEMMIRPARFRALGLRFDPRFGLGAEHPLGDEYVLIADALRAGLRGRRLPVALGTHPPRSSGDDWGARACAARAAVLARAFGPWTGPAALAFALRHRRRLAAAGGVAGFLRQCLAARRAATGRPEGAA